MRSGRLGPLVEGGLPGVLAQELPRRRQRRLRLAHREVRRLAGPELGPHRLGRLRHVPKIRKERSLKSPLRRQTAPNSHRRLDLHRRGRLDDVVDILHLDRIAQDGSHHFSISMSRNNE